MNVLNIYFGPFLKFRKNPNFNARECCGLKLNAVYLPEEENFDIWRPSYGEKGAPTYWETNHREVGEDYSTADQAAERIKELKQWASKTIEALTQEYGSEPTYHFGLITGWG